MKPITKLYLKIFLLAAGSYALILILYDLITGNKFGFWEYLIMPILSGAFMSSALVSFQKSRLKNDEIEALTKEKI